MVTYLLLLLIVKLFISVRKSAHEICNSWHFLAKLLKKKLYAILKLDTSQLAPSGYKPTAQQVRQPIKVKRKRGELAGVGRMKNWRMGNGFKPTNIV